LPLILCREKNQALNYLRLASRIDAVAARLETAIKMRAVSASMANIVRGMDKALQTMDTQKISQVMDRFEQQFEDLDVQVDFIPAFIR
jgi:charged multivesicular body protein 1